MTTVAAAHRRRREVHLPERNACLAVAAEPPETALVAARAGADPDIL